ncbi:MAG: hypothetical protein K1X88_18055 [Nannocystaceae bacterium]|nr:hypothetical protein [Nannocystaceae bacterium]
MNRRPTPATLLLLPLAFACQAAESPSVQRHYLLGTDADEIAAIAEVYEVDPLALADQLVDPLDCAVHEELCGNLGRAGAQHVVETAWQSAREGADTAEIERATIAAMMAAPAASESEGFRSFKPPDGVATYLDEDLEQMRVRVRASQYTILWSRYHKAQIWSEWLDPDLSWVPSAANLYVELAAHKESGGSETDKTCDDSKFDDTTSCFRTISVGGTQTTHVSGTVAGHTAMHAWE